MKTLRKNGAVQNQAEIKRRYTIAVRSRNRLYRAGTSCPRRVLRWRALLTAGGRLTFVRTTDAGALDPNVYLHTVKRKFEGDGEGRLRSEGQRLHVEVQRARQWWSKGREPTLRAMVDVEVRAEQLVVSYEIRLGVAVAYWALASAFFFFGAYASRSWFLLIAGQVMAWVMVYGSIRSNLRWYMIHALSQAGVALELRCTSQASERK
jgi:hypothetical protein